MSPCCVKGNAPSPSICDPDWCLLVAKFHYTDPTGPDRTCTDVFAARVSEKLRWVRAGLRQSPRGSGRARVVESSLYHTDLAGVLAAALYLSTSVSSTSAAQSTTVHDGLYPHLRHCSSPASAVRRLPSAVRTATSAFHVRSSDLFCSRPGGLELVIRLPARSVTFL